MSDANAATDLVETAGGTPAQYVVVARRYRPQTFDELVGQQHVAQALSNAISTQRVGHAYLFTGARGVGKTSAARILAKALNCEKGPTPVPCNQCDTCRSISSGEDVDVLEIDGASNRGIDEIRQLRQNVNVRPSRSRHKIYIIDEVHMLTREAFNALLKTLEEPPEHVKFIFCTTEATKIPITILSRCQRFDFAGIQTGAIAERLRQIVAAENVAADPAALELLARRAAGSMRDSQSLLEQLLAFASGRITLDDVHRMLGTAGDQRLCQLVGHLVDRDAASALADLDAALGEGVDVAQLVEQLFGYLRDCMASAVGCGADSLLYASSASQQEVTEAGRRLGLQTILAIMQILDQTLSRLRFSTHGRILAELALVRICHLEDLDELSALIARVQSGVGPAIPAAVKKKSEPALGPAAESVPPGATAGLSSSAENTVGQANRGTQSSTMDRAPPSAPAVELEPGNATEVWNAALSKLSGMVVEHARQFDRVRLVGSNRLVVSFKARYAFQRTWCERPDSVGRFETALAEVAGRPVRIEFAVDADESDVPQQTGRAVAPASPHQRLLEVVEHPLVRRAIELFGAQPIRVDDPPNRE